MQGVEIDLYNDKSKGWCQYFKIILGNPGNREILGINIANLTIESGPVFWPRHMHEPLLVLIVFPFAHIPSFRGPWVLKGTDAAVDVESRLTSGFKLWKAAANDPGRFSELDSAVPQMWQDPEEWSRTVLLQFLAQQREFPPVRKCVVRGLLHKLPDRPLPTARLARRRGRHRVGPSGGERVSKRARRGSSNDGL